MDRTRRRVEYRQHRGDVQGEGWDESAKWSGIQDEKKRTKNRTLGNTTRAGMRGRETIFTFDTKTTIRQVRLKPESACLFGQLSSNLDISDSDAGLKEENWGSVTGGEGECGERTDEMAAREKRSLWICDRLMLLLYTVSLSLCLLLKLNDDDDDDDDVRATSEAWPDRDNVR